VGNWAYHWLYQDFWAPLWPNLAASAVVYVFVLARLRALRKLHEELTALQAKHHAEHMDSLNPDTPGGLSAVLSEVRDAKAAAESAHAAIRALASVRGTPAPPWRRT
jgi:uncharacterized membrane protein YcjF (UPF0283 family)